VFAVGWPESWCTLPSSDLPFLEPQFVASACAELEFPEEVRSALGKLTRRVAADPALRAIAWHGVRSLYGAHAVPTQMQNWPSLVSCPLTKEESLLFSNSTLALARGLPSTTML